MQTMGEPRADHREFPNAPNTEIFKDRMNPATTNIHQLVVTGFIRFSNYERTNVHW